MASALGLVARIRVAQEALWLLAAPFLVPLAVVSPGYMIGDSLYSYAQIPKATLLRTVAALMVVLWAVEWAAGVGSPRSYANRNAFHRAASWVRDEPARWVVVAVGFLMAVTVVSALLSPVPRVSLLGEPESFGGYSLYMMASYAVLFLVVATHMKARRAQMIRLLWAISAAGLLVAFLAVLQHYDAEPFGFLDLGSGERSGSTLGNPIFAAAVLMLTVPITLAAALIATQNSWRSLLIARRGQLGTGCRLHPPDNEPRRRGVRLGLERGVSRLGDIGGAVHPVGNGSPVLLWYRLGLRRYRYSCWR